MMNAASTAMRDFNLFLIAGEALLVLESLIGFTQPFVPIGPGRLRQRRVASA